MASRKILPNLNRIKIPTTTTLDHPHTITITKYPFITLLNNPKGPNVCQGTTINVKWLDILSNTLNFWKKW